MPSTTTYEFGDVVLVPFPFSDLTTTKKRPAVIVSSPAFHREQVNVIVMAITSVLSAGTRAGEASLSDWRSAGLVKPSIVKPMLATLAKKLLIIRLGRLSQRDADAVRGALALALGPA